MLDQLSIYWSQQIIVLKFWGQDIGDEVITTQKSRMVAYKQHYDNFTEAF